MNHTQSMSQLGPPLFALESLGEAPPEVLAWAPDSLVRQVERQGREQPLGLSSRDPLEHSFRNGARC